MSGLSFFKKEFGSIGRSFKGYISSHLRRDFITYRVRIGNNALWFDTPELALLAFEKIEDANFLSALESVKPGKQLPTPDSLSTLEDEDNGN